MSRNRRKKITGDPLSKNSARTTTPSFAELDDALYGKLAEIDSLDTQALQMSESGELRLGAFVLTSVGLRHDTEPTQADWQQLGDVLFKLEESIQWLIGDWIAYGQDVGWGDIPTLAETLGRQAKTLHEYTYVSRHVQFSIRMENLSWSHHHLVASMDEDTQRHWLSEATQHGYSVSKLRQAISVNDVSKTPQIENSLADKLNKNSFNRIWRAVESGNNERISLDDIHRIETWLSQVKQRYMES